MTSYQNVQVPRCEVHRTTSSLVVHAPNAGRVPYDKNALYVTTNDGLIVPFTGSVQDAKLLRLDVGEADWVQI
jgi:hypothetical protein